MNDFTAMDKPAWYNADMAAKIGQLRAAIFDSNKSKKAIKQAIRGAFEWWAIQYLPLVKGLSGVQSFNASALFCSYVMIDNVLAGIVEKPYPPWVENSVQAGRERIVAEAHGFVGSGVNQHPSSVRELFLSQSQVESMTVEERVKGLTESVQQLAPNNESGESDLDGAIAGQMGEPAERAAAPIRALAPIGGNPPATLTSRSEFNLGETKCSNNVTEVNRFLKRCQQIALFKVSRMHIWKFAGHKTKRQFNYWQAGDTVNTTNADRQNFRRILSMDPADFIAHLEKKDLA